MERREAPPMIEVTPARAKRRVAPAIDVYEANFGRLASDLSWRKTWSAIIAGKFTSSLYSGLLFVEESTAYAELYDTDGHGHIIAPRRRQYDPLGDRTTWSHIVPGLFGPSGFTGLLLYDQPAGFGAFYGSNGQGGFTLQRDYTGWRNSWTHIVTGRFVASSPYSSIFFYSTIENYGEIWAVDGSGLAGDSPHQIFSNYLAGDVTHIVAGDFHWTPASIDSTPTLTDLFFYNAANGHGEMYRCDVVGENSIILSDAATASSESLPLQATHVIAGNFGGLGNTDLAFYDSASGLLSFYCFKDTSDTSAELVLREKQPGLRRNIDIIVSGNFWMSDPEDHLFVDGPPVPSTQQPPGLDPQWRFGTGAFSDLLFYDRNAGLGEFYFHEPLPPPVEPLDGYITSQSSHGGGVPVSTGSVLPGESLAFHVSSHDGPYSITIYRVGSFNGGPTEEMMATIEGLPSNPAPFPIKRDGYREGAKWPAVARFIVPDWPSGLYLARVETTAASSPTTIDLPFVVRAPGGSPTPVLLVLADCTYYAYEYWGGRSSYGHLSGGDLVGAFPSTSALRIPFGFQLSFERPVHGVWGNGPQTREIPFIKWMARRGIPVNVCTSRDLHFEPPNPDDYSLLLFVGHHEYWTSEMRTNVESFVKSGGNVAFFSGNTCWWQIRITSDGQRLICYKVAGFDPMSTTADHALATVHWFDDLVKRPETALTGVSWRTGGIFYDDCHRFLVKKADHWAFAETNLVNGQTFGSAAATAGTETDCVQGPDGPNGLISPPDYTLASIYDLTFPALEVGTMGSFSPGRGSGVVFNAATVNWASGLHLEDGQMDVIDQITLNVITRLGPSHLFPWTTVSEGSSTPGGQVTAIISVPNQVALFLADPAGGVYTTSGNANDGWRPWTNVSEGSSTPGAPIAVMLTGPNRITLFLADPAGGIYTTSGNTHDGWQPWTSVSEGSSTPGGQVTAVLTGANRIAVFLADPAGGIYTTSGNAHDGWQTWSSVSEGTSIPGAPITAVLTAHNRVALFLADPAGGVYTTSGSPQDGWQPWSSVSEGRSTPGAHISAVVTGWNRIALFLADPAGGIYTTSGNAHDGWRPWTSVSEGRTSPGAPVTAVRTGPNQIALFLADLAGGIYTTSGRTNSWQPWKSLSPQGRTTPGASISAVNIAPNQLLIFLADPGGGIYFTKVQLS
jgi:hypothetical protein